MDLARGKNLFRKSVLVTLILSFSCIMIAPAKAVIDDDYPVFFDIVYDIQETHTYGYSGESHYSDVQIFDVNVTRNSLSSVLSELTIYGYPLWLDVDSIEEGQELLIDRKNYTMSMVDDFWEGSTIGFYRAADSEILVYYDQELGFLESVTMYHLEEDDEWWAMLIQLRSESMDSFDELRGVQPTSYDYTDANLMSVIGFEVIILLYILNSRRSKS